MQAWLNGCGSSKGRAGLIMEFGSIVFILRFLPVFFMLYYLAPGRTKNVVLLLGSLCFYAWGEPICLLPMVLSACSDFIHALLIEKYRGNGTAKILLASALFFDLCLLFFFGYADFFIETANSLFGTRMVKIGFPLPVGITVYTLQTMSYVIDVYRGKIKAGRNLLEYATFVTMFPQLPIGPIIKYRDISEALRNRKMNLHQISDGSKRICVGLAKKVLIADVAGKLWKEIQVIPPKDLSMSLAWLGILAFAFQIYFMFSGYSDIAIGLGACMGFSLPENFDHPYVSGSVTEFLGRWNVTLTKWMKEYFYLSVSTKKKARLRGTICFIVTWGLVGLWYGPDWTFVLCGVWFALFYLLEKLFLEKVLSFFPIVLRWAYTILVVAVGWVFFMLEDVTDVWTYLQTAFGVGTGTIMDRRFWFLAWEYLPVLVCGAFFSFSIVSGLRAKLKTGKNGVNIAVNRLLEKIYPAVCLLLSLIYLVGREG